uniref:Paraneoplastic antigen Ma-like C-terminal domain-containing protein n=1 Tax=Cyclopterus lumpus TaxID=8103 RepID=A0A8C3G961_CYCLU
ASLALSGDRDEVSLEVTDEIIYKVLEGVKVGGRCKITGRCLDRVGKKQFVLVETTDDMTKGDIPEQLAAGDGEELWIVNVSETHKWHVPREHEGFQTKLLAFLANEGKTVADVTGLFSSTPAPTPALDLNTQLVNAISSLVEKCQATPADSLGYCKLRLFSGIKPTPLGEEEYDSWAEQTTRMLDEWQCSDVIKKQRVAESLKGPAANIVRGLRVTNPHATSNDYGQALETAFGTTDSAADLMGKFRTTFQRGGEKLSAYLLRLDKLLHAFHRRGGMEVADMNQVRIEQVARGALSNDFAALRIRLTYKLKPPPSFTELLRDIREEEEMILERLSVPTAGSRVESVLIDRPEEGGFPEGLLVMPVAEKPTVVHCRRIKVTLRNLSGHNVTLRRGMQIAHLFPVEVINTVPAKEIPTRSTSPLSPSSFDFGESPVPPEWKERLSENDAEEGGFLLQ